MVIDVKFGCIKLSYKDGLLDVYIDSTHITNKCYHEFKQEDYLDWMAYGECNYQRDCAEYAMNEDENDGGICNQRSIGCYQESQLAYYENVMDTKLRIIAAAKKYELSDDAVNYICGIIDMISNCPMEPYIEHNPEILLDEESEELP